MENRKPTLLLMFFSGVFILVFLGLVWALNTGKPVEIRAPSPTQDSLNRPITGENTPLIATKISSTLGDTLVGYGYIVTVDDTDHSDIFIDQYVASENHTMKAYHVTMESTSPGGVVVDPHFWRLFDSQTAAYPEIFAGKDPALATSKTLHNGEKLQGWLTYEVPKGASHFQLAYDIPDIPVKASFVFDVG